MASFSAPDFKLTSNQTALALIVPTNLQTEINSLRRIHDKAFRKWEPHINILYPFVVPDRLSSATAILREALHEKKQIKVCMEAVDVFRHRKNATVFLKPGVESEEAICHLRGTLVRALGCDEREGTHDGTFRPHLTIGQAGLKGASIEQLVEKVEKLLGLQWESQTLAILKRDASGDMRIIGELLLGRNQKTSKENQKMYPTDSGWRQCYSFTPDCGWSQIPVTAIASESRNQIPIEITISTYNLMADSLAPSFESRLQLIIQVISSTKKRLTSSLRVLCLQEINDEILPLLLNEPFIQRNFPFSTHTPSSLLPSHRNQVTLASGPFTCFDLLFSERHKTALVTSFSYLPLEVANIHLTSALTNQAVNAKNNQMATLTHFFTHERDVSDKMVVASGDFNLTTSSRTIGTALSKGLITLETAQLVGSVIDPDIWEDTFNSSGAYQADHAEAAFEGEEGATFDRLVNHLAAMSESPIDNRPQRYDRVLFQKRDRVRVEDFEIFGLPTEQGQCASDHYGVCVTLRTDVVDGPHLNQSLLSSNLANVGLGKIEVVEASTDIQPLIEPYLPSGADREQRVQALHLLQQTLTSNKATGDLLLAPLGSYFMETYFADSDVDVLAIGSIPPHAFFDFATKRLRALDDGFKGVHFVNSLVSVVEVHVLGIKFDLQYCQAAELLERYHSTKPSPNLATLVFHPALISSLPPSSIRPLNTYRDTAYLLNTLPDLASYRIAHRYLSLYLKHRGLYSAKFGYLGGIHLSLMLNHIVKLIATSTDTKVSPATIIRTFFTYYAGFNWAQDNVIDPLLHSHHNVSREARDSVFIYSIHTPTARRNVSSSCTRLSAQTFTQEFNLAAKKLQEGYWNWCLRPPEASIYDFLEQFGAFVRIQADVWDVEEIGGDKVRGMVGSLESKIPRLMVDLGKVVGLDGRVWPARFQARKGESGIEEESQEKEFKGYYLVGISCQDGGMDVQTKKLFTGKVVAAVREFETSVKESREFEGGNIWISMEVVPKKKILDMDLLLDDRDWSRVEQPRPVKRESATEKSHLGAGEATRSNLQPESSPRSQSTSSSLRPAHDIISRIHWDSALSVDDFVIGYEDRFVGVKEIELSKWKSEQTDDEFIPMHRIVWVRRKGEEGGGIVWDRRKKVDLIFGSGVRSGTRQG